MDLLSRLFIFSAMKGEKKFTNVFTQNISELAALKLVMWQNKLFKYCWIHWHLQKPQINLVSLWGDSFTDVGYSISQVETFLGCILNWFIVNTNGGNITRMCYSETRHDYLIIKSIIVYRWYVNLPLEWNKIIPLPFFP